MKIILKCQDTFVSEEILNKIKDLFLENKDKILETVKEVLGDDFKEKEITVNFRSQVGQIVYGGTEETEERVEVFIEVPQREPKHSLNILGWELVFALAKKKAYEIFFKKFQDYALAEILADQIGVLVEKEVIYKVGLQGYRKSTILDHSSPRSPVLYKLQKKLIEEWPNLKKHKSLSEWLENILKDFSSEIEFNELSTAYFLRKQNMILDTLNSILREIRRIGGEKKEKTFWQVEI